jgi:hypothetical protein
MKSLLPQVYKCDFAVKITPSEPFPNDTDTLETLENNIVGLNKEMALMQWFQEVYEDFIGLNTATIKKANGEFIETMADFLKSPQVEFFKLETENSLKLKIVIQKSTACWYELSVQV